MATFDKKGIPDELKNSIEKSDKSQGCWCCCDQTFYFHKHYEVGCCSFDCFWDIEDFLDGK